MYLNIKDEYEEDRTRLNVWLMEGDLQHRPLLKYVMTEKTLANTLVVLTASMAQPWNIIESLNEWSEVLETHINRLRLLPEDLQEYKASLVRHFQEYADPDSNKLISSSSWRLAGSNPLHPPSRSDENKDGMQLDDSVFSRNLGIPIVVVITKSDLISVLEKEYSYREEHFDFIQHHVRQFCLAHGAALIYTSAKEGTNCDLLTSYLTHRIYGLPFNTAASPVEKEAVFIPAGWDNEKKMAILQESFTNFRIGTPYKDVIVPVIVRKQAQRDPDMAAEDEQTFLSKLQATASKQPITATPRDTQSPMRPAMTTQASPRQNLPTAGNVVTSPPQLVTNKKMDVKGGPTSESVLSSFFNSLLTKKTGSMPAGKDVMASDGVASDLSQPANESSTDQVSPPTATAN